MTTSTVTIVLGGSPQGKGRARVGRGGNVFTPARTRSYEAALRYAAQEAMGSKPPMVGPVAVQIDARMPIPQSWPKKTRELAIHGAISPVCKPDADNLLKCMDALNQIIWVDDKQVVRALVTKRYHEQPALVIDVTPILAGQG